MKRTNLLTLIIVPAIIAGLMGIVLFALSNHVNIYSHDIFESHSKYMLLPFICAVSLFLGYIPAFCYLSTLLHSIAPVTAQGTEEITAITSQAPGLHIGQVFTASGANCGFRVKAIKSIFADLQEDQYNHCLQFSY